MKEIQWTREQQEAIYGRGGSILVSAAAGSGKTAVLSERVVEMLTREEDPVDADRLLVVTFSNAAAREMKQRISRRLWELSREDPGNARLARQQLLPPPRTRFPAFRHSTPPVRQIPSVNILPARWQWQISLLFLSFS